MTVVLETNRHTYQAGGIEVTDPRLCKLVLAKIPLHVPD